jgi:hypothetical protein
MSPSARRILLVVRRNEPEMYALMRERYRGVAFVILDRRHSERRRRQLPVEPDLRRRDRRRPWTTEALKHFDRLGYRLLYRAEGVEVDPTTSPPPGS